MDFKDLMTKEFAEFYANMYSTQYDGVSMKERKQKMKAFQDTVAK